MTSKNQADNTSSFWERIAMLATYICPYAVALATSIGTVYYKTNVSTDQVIEISKIMFVIVLSVFFYVPTFIIMMMVATDEQQKTNGGPAYLAATYVTLAILGVIIVAAVVWFVRNTVVIGL